MARERPQLAISMAVRRRGADVEPTGEALAAAFPAATGQLVLFLHGLCEDESYWDRHRDRVGATYAEMLTERGWTPLMLRANTGLPLRENWMNCSRYLTNNPSAGFCEDEPPASWRPFMFDDKRYFVVPLGPSA